MGKDIDAIFMVVLILIVKYNVVVELHQFYPIEGISDTALIKAIRKTETRFFRFQPGFIRCEVLLCSECWANIRYWESKQTALDAHKRFLESSCCFPFIQMISPLTERKFFLSKVLSSSSAAK